MDTATLLWRTVQEQRICPGVDSLEAWLGVRWGRMRIGPWQVPVLPVFLGLRNGLLLHDIHHVLTGYDTTYRGEARLAVWELASGGCGWSAFFWLDRLCFLAMGLAICPGALPAAFRRGRRARNLYGEHARALLETPFDELRARVFPERVD